MISYVERPAANTVYAPCALTHSKKVKGN